MSLDHKGVFDRGVKIAQVRGADKNVCGIGISIDDMIFKQLFTGEGAMGGRLDVLVHNCKGKLDRLTRVGWSPKYDAITNSYRL